MFQEDGCFGLRIVCDYVQNTWKCSLRRQNQQASPIPFEILTKHRYVSAQNPRLNMAILSHFQQELQKNRLTDGINSL